MRRRRSAQLRKRRKLQVVKGLGPSGKLEPKFLVIPVSRGVSLSPVTFIEIHRLLERIQNLGNKMDRAFAGQLFNLKFSPTSPANRRRFRAYCGYQAKLMTLLHQAIDLQLVARSATVESGKNELDPGSREASERVVRAR